MNRYRQLTSGERYALSALRKQGCNQAAIARALGRHRSTISREVRRNSKDRQGRAYRPDLAYPSLPTYVRHGARKELE